MKSDIPEAVPILICLLLPGLRVVSLLTTICQKKLNYQMKMYLSIIDKAYIGTKKPGKRFPTQMQKGN